MTHVSGPFLYDLCHKVIYSLSIYFNMLIFNVLIHKIITFIIMTKWITDHWNFNVSTNFTHIHGILCSLVEFGVWKVEGFLDHVRVLRLVVILERVVIEWVFFSSSFRLRCACLAPNSQTYSLHLLPRQTRERKSSSPSLNHIIYSIIVILNNCHFRHQILCKLKNVYIYIQEPNSRVVH